MPIPIIVTAFGTTTRALETYSLMDIAIRQEFPGHEVHWAFSSRMVKDRLHRARRVEIKHPHQVLLDLQQQGHVWAVVQSLHLLAGHEFVRLLEEVASSPVRTSIGLPLLSSLADYQRLAEALIRQYGPVPGEALVLVGHGTDHPAWSAYPALEAIMRQRYGPGVYVGVIEGYPDQDQVVREIVKAGHRAAKLVPLMLVAGRHFQEDLTEGEDSWRAVLAAAGLQVEVAAAGLGAQEGVVRIFLDHIRAALEVIPATAGQRPAVGGGRAAGTLSTLESVFPEQQESLQFAGRD